MGFQGTLAVLLGTYLHVDFWGHLHWSTRDLLIGLACGLPLLAQGEPLVWTLYQRGRGGGTASY